MFSEKFWKGLVVGLIICSVYILIPKWYVGIPAMFLLLILVFWIGKEDVKDTSQGVE